MQEDKLILFEKQDGEMRVRHFQVTDACLLMSRAHARVCDTNTITSNQVDNVVHTAAWTMMHRSWRMRITTSNTSTLPVAEA